LDAAAEREAAFEEAVENEAAQMDRVACSDSGERDGAGSGLLREDPKAKQGDLGDSGGGVGVRGS
jgi:hypothetical protein